ncbi:MAG: CBS domain-containing protein [Acidobacteria bacterium]|nr:CBS domain-containing protein [Acidobacteriota bacterium]
MLVKDLLEIKGRTVYTTKATDTLRQAVNKMVRHNVGSLLVVDDQARVIGIITERDVLCKCVHEGKNPDQEHVQKHFTATLLIITPGEDVGSAMDVMTRNRIRHLPVVEADSLEGIISIGDVVKAQLHEYHTENRYLKDYITAKYPG